MAMGMSYEQYWYGDVRDIPIFIMAYKETIKRENTTAWLQGLYVFDAISAALANAFRDKNSPAIKYAEEPFDLFPDETERKREEKEEAEAIFAKAYMQQMVDAGKNWGKGR